MSTHDALPARWYSVSNDGLATRCHDEEDARYNAAQNDMAWPRGAPHRAVQLVEVAEVARAVEAERERIDHAIRQAWDATDGAHANKASAYRAGRMDGLTIARAAIREGAR